MQCKYVNINQISRKCNDYYISHKNNKDTYMCRLPEWKRKVVNGIKGFTDCGCNAGFSPGIVLDPFFGAGTTGLVALKQNKRFIGFELNPDYIEIAMKRLKPYLTQTKLTNI
jgi:hypothetical protein